MSVEKTNTDTSYRPPTPFMGRFVRYIVGFGVGLALGVAPFLGGVDLKGFVPLVAIFPPRYRDILIPFSSFLLGVIGVGVQFYAGEKISTAKLKRRFKLGFIAVIGGLFLLLVVFLRQVTVISVPATGETRVVVTSLWRLPDCGCKTLSDRQCMEEVGLTETGLSSCWGGTGLLLVQVLLMAGYLALVGGFVGLVGLLLLRDQQASAKRSRSPPPP